ncbi:cob(I)yrinic acid a,c-diamide adenosyltransferase [Sandaracinobacter sp. RS1-74]|uniref:cob(I)yrinic acid a,c-diamide adenosyltransferase n=1 Tax=Sandaracinobacteroides sayramensis TaxID=2913411 RepID=UPI001EDC05EE|nr:cob(I)yrinic acid a,c-diamide adenosyltransferase [Sandaracinobacteroides sayramensis]MCG2839876.1 cob(I)yrinic acid a,c-diamide adenosyltransferase [Sandaracinobacteroides sayramensis]
MVRLNKIYTRTGDDGSTGLVGGERIAKNSPRVAAYGTVDEANSALGVARLHAGGETLAMIGRIQNDLFDVGADLATPGEDFRPGAPQPEWPPLRTVQSQIDRLEAEIDAMNAELQPLNSFILPGGTALSAHLHLARAIVRRAERDAVTAAGGTPVNPAAVRYLNRLSDHLFVLARHANRAETGGEGDILWVPAANR